MSIAHGTASSTAKSSDSVFGSKPTVVIESGGSNLIDGAGEFLATSEESNAFVKWIVEKTRQNG